MDKMSLFSVLTVSIPEYILDIYVAFLITGEKTHLYLSDKINVVRLAITISLLSIGVWVVRAAMPNLYFIMISNFFLYIIILKFIYSFKWTKSIINVLIIFGILLAIESIYTPIFFQMFKLNLEKLLGSDIDRLIYTIPERIMQISIIVSIWNWNGVYINLKEYKKARVPFIVFIVIFIAVEWFVFLIFCLSFDKFTILYKVIFAIAFLCFALANFSMFKFISTLTNSILEDEWVKQIDLKKKYGNEKKQVIKYLENGNVVSAMNALKEN